VPEGGTLLAHGRWRPETVETVWRDEPWQTPEELDRRADEAIDALRKRGSPSHDGLAARLASWEESDGVLRLELQPVRWALRLVEQAGVNSMTALCVVRSEDGRWLAGKRAGWLASWAGRWALGAGGSVEVGEDPVLTLSRELEEEWRLRPASLTVEALAALPSGLVALVGLATVPADAQPVPDDEHDEFAWWPADVERWPDEADERLRRMAALLAAASS
jgi:ADP-ribose pyrophosphatase YjhB (NUDIX family)